MKNAQEIIKTVQKIQSFLIDRKKTLSSAESCTGGLVSYYLTALSGSSGMFVGGVATYSNDSKIILLGLSIGLI